MTIDLDAYFARIGFKGRADASIATLREIHRLHPSSIPFESLDPFMGENVSLDPGAIERKLVHGRRGGYCYEQNLHLMEVLRALGFRVKGLAARVLWNRPADAVTPRSHMLLAVEHEGETLLADVGFGGLTQTGPLRLVSGIEQETPHEPFRVLELDGTWLAQAHAAGEWRNLYRFDLTEHVRVDYEVSSFFLCRHPASHFISGLMAARALPDRRLALMNNRYAVHVHGAGTERRELESPEDVAAVLERDFGIAIADRPAFLDAAERKIFAAVPA